MAESRTTGPGGYKEVSGTAGTPHPATPQLSAPSISTPFTPPDTSSMGYGQEAGGASSTHGGGLAGMISGGGRAASLLGDIAEVAEIAAL